jgi:hypothetical protein
VTTEVSQTLLESVAVALQAPLERLLRSYREVDGRARERERSLSELAAARRELDALTRRAPMATPRVRLGLGGARNEAERSSRAVQRLGNAEQLHVTLSEAILSELDGLATQRPRLVCGVAMTLRGCLTAYYDALSQSLSVAGGATLMETPPEATAGADPTPQMHLSVFHSHQTSFLPADVVGGAVGRPTALFAAKEPSVTGYVARGSAATY